MSITTYSELQAAIANWLARSDLTSVIPDFITLFEAQAAKKLRVRPMEATATLSVSAGSATLPADYLGYRRATVTSSPRVDMEYVAPSYLQALYPNGITAVPAYFTIEASAIKTRSSDVNPIEFLYLAKTPALSGALNWLFTNHPDVYLAGSLFEAYSFVKNYEEAAVWKARRDEGFEDIKLVNFREANGLAVRPMGAFP
jgi:hypothetical protein